MRKNHTHRGFYVNLHKKSDTGTFLKGRIGKNMSVLKIYEYQDFLWYLHFHEFQKYGLLLPIYRLRKNLKYRKSAIKRWEKEDWKCQRRLTFPFRDVSMY